MPLDSLGVTLSAPQAMFVDGLKTKFRAYVGGFGCGKTFVGCFDLLSFAGKHPGLTQGYFAPSYNDIEDTFWPTLEEVCEMLGFEMTVNKSKKRVDLFYNGAWYGNIICRSMDQPQNIKGFKIVRAMVDEIDVMPADKALIAWRKIIARMRLVVEGVVNSIGVTTTPEGFKFVYNTFARNPTESYSMVQASTYENAAFLPPDYIPSLIETYPQELISAYLNGDFVNLTSGTVYRNYSRTLNRSTEIIRDKEPLHIGQDFNVGEMASVVFVERPDGLHAVGELTGILDTPALIETIKSKWPDRAIYVYPDASGGSRKTVNASESDITLLRSAGFKVRVRPSNPAVKDRILSVNSAYSQNKLWVNDTFCPNFAESQEQQAYDKNGEPDKASGFDHLNDGGGYCVYWHFAVNKPKATIRGLSV